MLDQLPVLQRDQHRSQVGLGQDGAVCGELAEPGGDGEGEDQDGGRSRRRVAAEGAAAEG
jgi:hypothetical protein